MGDKQRVSEILERLDALAEERESGVSRQDLSEEGFWDVVEIAKGNSSIAREFGPRIGLLDREAFEAGSTLPVWLGSLLAILVTGTGAALLYTVLQGMSVGPTGPALVVSALLLSVGPHHLTHVAVGRIFGIGFHFYFLNGALRIEPTVKTDYDSYVRASRLGRSVMHLSGAVPSTLLPLLVLYVSIREPVPPWSTGLLGLICFLILFVELLPVAGIVTGERRLMGLDVSRTDLGRAYRELGGWR